MRQRLDPMTQTVFDFIRRYIDENHFSPTLREIGEGCYTGHTSILRHLDRLEGMGWIEREPGKPRSIRIGPLAPRRDPDDQP